MTSTGNPTTTTPGKEGSFAWCTWHKGHSQDARLINVFEEGSGPGTGRSQYACAACRSKYNLVPFSERPL